MPLALILRQKSFARIQKVSDSMVKKIKAIIFDWGRTCWDSEKRQLADGVEDVLKFLESKNLPLALVSLVNKENSEPIEERRERIEKSSIRKYFDVFVIGEGYDKDPLLEDALLQLKIPPAEILVVDDRVIRGIAWINRNGGMSVWFKSGKFANELSKNDEQKPNFTVSSMEELQKLLEELIT